MLFYYLLFINVSSFIIMFIDKKLAVNRKRRISEKFLFLCAFLLGSLGVYLGMFAFRHKTKKYKFFMGIPILILIQAVIYYILRVIFFEISTFDFFRYY